MKRSHFSKDILDFLGLLYDYKVRYLIVGGEAVIYYGHARLTGDIDIFYDNSENNVDKLFNVLKQFWSGNIPSLKNKEELKEPELILQFGVPPNRIDLINKISGVSFQKAWANKETISIKINQTQMNIHYIGINELAQNKEAIGRFKDMDDLRFLRMALNNTKKKKDPTKQTR